MIKIGTKEIRADGTYAYGRLGWVKIADYSKADENGAERQDDTPAKREVDLTGSI